jgi:hypothetical protein
MLGNFSMMVLGPVIGISLVLNGPIAFAAVEPLPESATLEWNGRVISPSSVTPQFVPEYQVSNQVLIVSNATINSLDVKSRNVLWTAVCSNADRLRWIGVDSKIAYLQVFQKDGMALKPERKARILRLDLSSGKFLADFSVAEGREPETIFEASLHHDALVILSANLTETKFTRYRVTCFDTVNVKQKWSKSFAAAEEDPNWGPFLLSSVRPNEAWSSVRNLSWLGDDVLVCAGAKQILLCLKKDTGQTGWSIERPWEFQRGFIGPSVWQHYISRFGEESRMFPKNVSVNPSASKSFDEKWSCKIVGGPIVVNRRPADEDPEGASIFVAISKAPKEGKSGSWAAYLSDCLVYEFDKSGRPLSMVTLPRMVDGSLAQVETNAVVWNCQNDATVKLETTQSELALGMGPGGFDRLTKITWYRQFDINEPKAWLVTDKANDPLAFDSDGFFRVVTGGYVFNLDDKVFNLPISFVDYANGTTSQMLLRLPVTGAIPKPETNYRSTTRSDSGIAYHTSGPYFLGITGLDTKGKQLVVTIGMDEWHAALTFDLSGDKAVGK